MDHNHDIVELIGVTRYIGAEGLETKTWFLWLNCADHPLKDLSKSREYTRPCHSTLHDQTLEGSIDFVGQYHFLCEYNDRLFYYKDNKENRSPMRRMDQ